MTSWMTVGAPWASRSRLDSTSTGSAASSGVPAMKEPVTTTSSTSDTGADATVCAIAELPVIAIARAIMDPPPRYVRTDMESSPSAPALFVCAVPSAKMFVSSRLRGCSSSLAEPPDSPARAGASITYPTISFPQAPRAHARRLTRGQRIDGRQRRSAILGCRPPMPQARRLPPTPGTSQRSKAASCRGFGKDTFLSVARFKRYPR